MIEIDLTKLCYYDRRNPDFSIKEEYGYDKEEVEATGNFAKKDCYCDNCFYGRSQLTEQLIKSQEMFSFSEEDMIDFTEWLVKRLEPNYDCDTTMNFIPQVMIHGEEQVWIKGNEMITRFYTTKELLQLWKEQQPKIVYYENN